MSERMAEITRNESGRPDADEVAKYLPFNYKVTDVSPVSIWIRGEDDHGWTLDDYVIPRLHSGNIGAREVPIPAEVAPRYPGENEYGEFRADVYTPDDGPHWYSNGLRFDTRDDALAYAKDLSRRWMKVKAWRAVPVTTPVRQPYEAGSEDGSW